jgi:hypothetical protein
VTLLSALPGDADPSVRTGSQSWPSPLYAEQLLAYSNDGGALESVPPNVEVLASEHLLAGERSVLSAAVIGREFSRAITALQTRRRRNRRSPCRLSSRRVVL